MKMRPSLILSLTLTLCALAGLLIFPDAATSGAKAGLVLCAAVIIPSIFPFTVITGLLLDLRFPHSLGKLTRPLMHKLFNVSGPGSAAFILGLAGGYPLGAVTVSDMYSAGQIEKKEAERLLGFCNNCGSAFILAVAGSAVFGSTAVGFFLYGVHVLAAVFTGILLRGKTAVSEAETPVIAPADFPTAFSSGVIRACTASLTVCGFVVFFSVLIAILNASGILPALIGRLAAETGLELHFAASLITGIFEIGTGIGSMLGLSLTAVNAALAAFISGWGGLSVQAQAAAVVKESGLSARSLLYGKLIHGVLSALLAFLTFPLLF